MIDEILLQVMMQADISSDDWDIVDEWIEWKADNEVIN